MSAISLVEVVYLTELGRIPTEALRRLQDAIGEATGSLVAAPVDSSVVDVMRRIPRERVPDMPDRIIAATALRLGAELITRDRKLQSALGNRAIW